MSYPKSPNQNWVKDSNLLSIKAEDKKRLTKLKSDRSKKRFRLVKVSDMPLTYVEKEIKEYCECDTPIIRINVSGGEYCSTCQKDLEP